MGTVNRLRCSLLYNTKVYICRLIIRECAHLYHFSVLLMYHIIIRKIEKKRTPKVIRWRMVFLFYFSHPRPYCGSFFYAFGRPPTMQYVTFFHSPRTSSHFGGVQPMLYLYARMRVLHMEAFLNYMVAGDSGVEKNPHFAFFHANSSVLSLEYVCLPLPYPTYPNAYLFFFGILHWNTIKQVTLTVCSIK